ncbi:MAG: hypothetical protein KY461_12865, partial [Actinobacteria bacterium]|nr:hypothetical protein [Actinomycetota bacterium]
MRAPDHGVQFPETDGRRSTQQASVDVLASAVADVDPILASAISGEREWRKHYPRHLRAVTARAAASGEAASAIARAGLDRLHATFEVVDEHGGARPLGEAVAGEPEVELGTRYVAGEGDRATELVVPYRGRDLRGDELVAQAEDWAARGVVEPSFVAALRRVVAHPEWLDLTGWSFGLLGAGAEMGPTAHLLSWGAEVAAVDIPSPRVWERLGEMARAGAGRLAVPTRPDGGDGVDLITEPAAVRAWLAGLTPATGPLVLGNYAYADGADFVRVAMAADTVLVSLQRQRDDIALAYLATPTDVFAAPPEAVAMSRARQRAAGPLVGLAHRLTAGRGFVPNYRLTVTDEAGRELGIADSLVVQQGPNYALAKRLQRWRALVAHQ